MTFLLNIDVPDVAKATTFYTEAFGLTVGRRFGADFAFTAIFIGLVAGFVTTRRHVAVVVASAAAATLVHQMLGSPWHVLAGAFAGMAMAVVVWRPEAEAVA